MIKEELKRTARGILNALHIDLTRNLEYDRLTKLIIKKYIEKTSNCIDIGCHKGEILDLFLKYAVEGKHFAFEPIPDFFHELKTRYKDKCEILPFALGEKNETTVFNYVKNDPAYSGIKKRRYDIKNPEIEKIDVQVKKLDDVIPKNICIDLIKIDVEGAEFMVLKGARKIIQRCKPMIIFEFGLGASDYYGTTPEDIFTFFDNDTELSIYNLRDWIKKKKPLNKEKFINTYRQNSDYYFVATQGFPS
jgi:FkbM family methyltransferase